MMHMKPADIERRSMEIITGELRERGITLPEENAPVIRRVIHTTADFDYVEQLVFTPGAVWQGIKALHGGKTVVTDTNMALSGVSKPGLKKLGSQAVCFMADPEVAAEAKRRGCTRAVISAEKAARTYPDCIYAVGNAPTALFEIAAQLEKGFRPSLVIGVPVGFVNVVEAKETLLAACQARGIPAIVAMGRKGGSTVAAAILNALIYQAAQMQQPEQRGW